MEAKIVATRAVRFVAFPRKLFRGRSVEFVLILFFKPQFLNLRALDEHRTPPRPSTNSTRPWSGFDSLALLFHSMRSF